MAERGTYRSVKVVLLDGPDYRQLSERSRHVFLTLKLTFGPSGIEVREPEALPHELAAKTGIPSDAVRGCLEDLERAGWIEREGNVVWILGQLHHDPGMVDSNPKHRKGIQSHVGGLPRLSIVRRFVVAHPAFFPPAEYADPVGYPKANDSHDIPIRFTEEGRGKTEERRPKSENLAPARETDSPPGGDDDESTGTVIHATDRLSASQVLHAWESSQPASVPEVDRRKQKPAARKIADHHTAEEVATAFIGMGQLFPHCPPKSEPWDLWDLDRKFAKALAKARDHPDIRSQAFDRQFLAATGGPR